MQALSERDLLLAWECGRGQHPIDRALTLLALGCPEKTREELIALSVGQRDLLLLGLRELVFGPRLDGFAECPACKAGLEFSLKIPDLRPTEVTQGREQELFLSADEFSVDYRLPNSKDLAVIAYARDVAAARDLLVSRCVLHACRAETDVVVEELPDTVIAEVAARMMENDPGSHMELDLTCPDCSHRWSMLLDIVSFFWTEIAARGKRLVHEVQSLARTYGWREADILAMSAWRRRLYLEAVS